MKTAKDHLFRENMELRQKLEEARELLAAIKSGAVDAFVTDDKKIFTLESADQAYRLLVETMNEGAATLMYDGTIMYCNNRMAQMLGRVPEKIIGSNIFDFVSGEHLQKFRSILRLSKARTIRAESLLQKSDRTCVPALISCSSMEPGGKGLCMVMADLTGQKNAAAELGLAQLELEHSKRLNELGMLASTVAHELRNPLATISTAAYNIRRKAKTPEIEPHLANIDSKVAESAQIINNLLVFSKLKPPNYEKTDIKRLLKESIKQVKGNRKTKAEIIKDFKSLRGVFMEADQVQLREVFINILNNSVDALNGKKGRIKIMAEDDAGSIRVHVSDNGRGIEESILAKIFDPFFTTKAKGTGLGLAVCKNIVDLHRGTIRADSKAGKGTTFTIRLPKTPGTVLIPEK